MLAVSLLWLAADLPAAPRAFLDRNCVGCHQGAQAAAALDLKTLPFDLGHTHNYSRWVRVHDMVRDRQMPPAGAKIADADRAAFQTSLGQALNQQEQQRVKLEGRSVLRRLNRYEYENTVRDLLDAPWLQLRDSLPEDGMLARFNKSGQALDVSHVQMARYLETAEDALKLVHQAGQHKGGTERFYARDQKRLQNRMRYTSFNRHPERATIPIVGFAAQPDVLTEKAPFSQPETRDLEGFATPAGNYVGNEHHFDQFTAAAGGRYKLTFHAYSLWIHTVQSNANRGDKKSYWRPDRTRTAQGRTLEPVTIYALNKGGKRLLGSFDVGPEPKLHELEVQLVPGDQILPDAARLFRSRPGFIGSPQATAEGMPGVAYRWMDVAGPLDAAAARASYTRLFDEAVPAETRLRQFVERAYRRPVALAEIERYTKIMSDRRASGSSAAEALIAGYTAVLCSPGFLYFEERPGPLNAWALASRLSYFLWNSAPDAELRKLAANGSLLRAGVLQAQTKRLLADPRSRRFTDAFLDYWLDLRRLNETTPDVVLYPDYYLDDLLTESAEAETQLFFAHLLQKNLPARTVVQSDFTLVNSHLARHYALPPVEGVAMRLVTLPPGHLRGGLLTQASVLKITANGTTTSPVLRGAWILERILGETRPPPPAGVPAVEPDTRGATTIRQQLDAHRSVASCAACHRKIDPPGFALENFDILGGWRERYRSTDSGEPVKGIGKNGHEFTFRAGQPVDASGELTPGARFGNVAELKALLARDERRLARNLVQQFIAYGTGGPVGFADRAEVERILDAARADSYGVRTLLQQVVQSRLFTAK